MGYDSWAQTHRRKKWRFAHKLATTNTGKWSQRILQWKPFFRCIPRRGKGHPHTRWEDHIVEVVGGDWASIASDGHLWDLAEEGFVNLDGI